MTINEINNSINSNIPLYVGGRSVKITFIEEITETIEIMYLDNNMKTYITKSSLSFLPEFFEEIVVDELLVMRKRLVRNV